MADSSEKAMISLIAKVLITLAVLVGGALVALNVTGVAKPGTISIRTPSVEPCERALAGRETVYVHVRWIWSKDAYGWGCFYEDRDGRTGSIAPMPR